MYDVSNVSNVIHVCTDASCSEPKRTHRGSREMRDNSCREISLDLWLQGFQIRSEKTREYT